MSIVDKAADIAAKDFAKSRPNEVFDPSVILVFADILMELIKAFQNCKAAQTPAQAAEVAKNPGLFQRVVLRRKVREVVGGQAWRQHGEEMAASLLRMGKTVTEEDMVEALSLDE